MLPGYHHQSDQSTGHICFNVLRIACPIASVFWIIRTGSDLFDDGGRGVAVLVGSREDDIAGLDSRCHSQRIPFLGLLILHSVVFDYRMVYTYRIRALERAHE